MSAVLIGLGAAGPIAIAVLITDEIYWRRWMRRQGRKEQP